MVRPVECRRAGSVSFDRSLCEFESRLYGMIGVIRINLRLIRLLLLAPLLTVVVGILLTHNTGTRPVHAFSSGPPAGYTGAPNEEPEACAECHVPSDAGSGTISITAPQTYVPGQTYPITVTHTNSDQTRLRWGF